MSQSSEYPLISIITPVYNGERFIRECIESVRSQDYPSIEHIIIDDGSTDNTVDIIKQYPHVTLLACAHAGAPAARNAGIKAARGHYVKFLDADDLLVNGALLLQQKASSGLAEGEIGYGYREVIHESGQPSEIIKREEMKYPNPVVDCILRNILTSLPLYPLDAVKAVGGFDERLQAAQEWDLNIRLALMGNRFVYQDILAYRQRMHDSAHRITNRSFDWARELKNYENTFEAIVASNQRVLLDAWAAHLWLHGRKALREGSPAGAKLFFARAQEISPDGFQAFLRFRYRLALRFLGPQLAEHLMTMLESRGW